MLNATTIFTANRSWEYSEFCSAAALPSAAVAATIVAMNCHTMCHIQWSLSDAPFLSWKCVCVANFQRFVANIYTLQRQRQWQRHRYQVFFEPFESNINNINKTNIGTPHFCWFFFSPLFIIALLFGFWHNKTTKSMENRSTEMCLCFSSHLGSCCCCFCCCCCI